MSIKIIDIAYNIIDKFSVNKYIINIIIEYVINNVINLYVIKE